MDDRLRPCKHISLELPSHILIESLWDSAPELESNQTVIQHVFLVVNFFAIRLYNHNDSHLEMTDLHSWLSGQSVALC